MNGVDNVEKSLTCCFTGHRLIPVEHYAALVAELESTVRSMVAAGVVNYICGGALAFDTLAAQCVLRLKPDSPQIKLLLALPCPAQSRAWKEHDKKVYEEIKRQADEVIYMSQEYTPSCMFERNRYMVDNSSICVCYLTRSNGGTAYTVRYAKKRGLNIINLAHQLI